MMRKSMIQKPFVLLVEDDDKLRRVIAANLSARGYVVFEANSFGQAIDQLAIKPHLMILDIGLPDATGWDIMRWAETQSVAVPTIVISALKPDRRQMEQFMPATFLDKPFAIRQLLELVEMYTTAPT